MVLIYVVAIVLAVGYFVYSHFTKYNNYWKDRNIKGPKPNFFLGNMKNYVIRRNMPGDVYKEIYDQFPNEKVVGIFRMRTPVLLVRDLEITKHILIKDFDLFVDRGIEFSDKGLGRNLFHADGDTWRVLRNRFSPLFSSGKLKNMMHLITDCADRFVDHVDKITQANPEQEIHPLVQKYTQASIAACAFGLDFDIFNEKMEILTRIDKLLFTLTRSVELDWMYPGILKKIGSSLFPKEATKFFEDLTEKVITERNGKPTNRNDFMDLILALRETKHIEARKWKDNDKERTLEMSDDVIAAQSFVFYAAGYETSASTMAFMIYELALNPDIQDKLKAEVDETLEKNNGEFTLDNLLGMEYIGQVFDETLRKYPLGEHLLRRAGTNYKVPGTDLVVEKGTTVIIPTKGILYNEQYFPDPHKFDPDRFSPENVAARHPCAYMPFGAGPRNCIGMRFAQVQSRMCMAKLLSKFRLEPSKNTVRNFEYDANRIIPFPIGGFHLNIVPRSLKK